MWIALVFLRKNTRIHKMGEIHELFVLALSLVWFAGATPDVSKKAPKQNREQKSSAVSRNLLTVSTKKPRPSKSGCKKCQDTPDRDKQFRGVGSIGFFELSPVDWPVFTRPFFPFAPFAGHPSFSPFLGTSLPFSPPQKVLCSVEQGAQRRAWRGAVPRGSSGMDLSRKFGKEIPSRNLREKAPLSFTHVQVGGQNRDDLAVLRLPWKIGISGGSAPRY